MKQLFLSAVSGLCMTLAASAAELLMVEQDGCHYCARWDKDIAHIYPKTREGAFAPLRRVNIRNLPQDIEFQSKPAFTPTFVLVEDGKELARLEGYPGEDLFWVMLERVLNQSPTYLESGS